MSGQQNIKSGSVCIYFICTCLSALLKETGKPKLKIKGSLMYL